MARKPKPWEAKIPKPKSPYGIRDWFPADDVQTIRTGIPAGEEAIHSSDGRYTYSLSPDGRIIMVEGPNMEEKVEEQFKITPGLLFPLKDGSWAVCVDIQRDDDLAICYALKCGPVQRKAGRFMNGTTWRWHRNGKFHFKEDRSYMDLDFVAASAVPPSDDIRDEVSIYMRDTAPNISVHLLYGKVRPGQQEQPFKIEPGMVLPMKGGQDWCVVKSHGQAISLTDNRHCNECAGRRAGERFAFDNDTGLYETREHHPDLRCHIDMDMINRYPIPSEIMQKAKKYLPGAYAPSKGMAKHSISEAVRVEPKTTVWRKENRSYPWGKWVGTEVTLAEAGGAL